MPVPYLKKLADQGHGSLPSLEKKWDEAKKIAKDEGKGENYGYITGILKKMLGIKSNVLASNRRLWSGTILSAMATAYDPIHSIRPEIKFSGHRALCHLATVKGIQRRGAANDRIWMFGDLEFDEVYHSLLTTGNNTVVVDAGPGRFQGTSGYHVPGQNPSDTEGITYDFIAMVEVSEWFDDYFDFTR